MHFRKNCSKPGVKFYCSSTKTMTVYVCNWSLLSGSQVLCSQGFHSSNHLNKQDYYQLLGISKKATQKEIKKAYYQVIVSTKNFHLGLCVVLLCLYPYYIKRSKISCILKKTSCILNSSNLRDMFIFLSYSDVISKDRQYHKTFCGEVSRAD